MRVHEAVQGLGAAGQEGQVALQGLGEGVEERPRRAGLELGVRRCTPLRHDLRQGGNRHDADIDRPDHEVVGGEVVDGTVAIPGNAGVLSVPALHELPDGALREQRQIPLNPSCVLPGQLHFTAEGQVVADEDGGPGHDAGGEPLIVAIAQAQDPRVVRVLAAVADLQKPMVLTSDLIAKRKAPDYGGSSCVVPDSSRPCKIAYPSGIGADSTGVRRTSVNQPEASCPMMARQLSVLGGQGAFKRALRAAALAESASVNSLACSLRRSMTREIGILALVSGFLRSFFRQSPTRWRRSVAISCFCALGRLGNVRPSEVM